MKRIIFDVDNTLIPVPDFSIPVKKLYEDFGISYTDSDVKEFIDAMASYDDYHTKYTMEEYTHHIDRFTSIPISEEMIRHYTNHPERLVQTEEDTVLTDTLEYLISRGYELVALTNYFTDVQTKRLDLVGVLKYLKQVIGGEEYIKPDVKAYYKAASEIATSECLFIGDNPILDHAAPRKFGFNSILYDPGYGYSNKDVINNFSYLRKVL